MKIKIWNTLNESEGDGADQETAWEPDEVLENPEYFENSVESEVQEYAEKDYQDGDYFDEQEYSARVGDEVWHYVVTVEFDPVFSASRKKETR